MLPDGYFEIMCRHCTYYVGQILHMLWILRVSHALNAEIGCLTEITSILIASFFLLARCIYFRISLLYWKHIVNFHFLTYRFMLKKTNLKRYVLLPLFKLFFLYNHFTRKDINKNEKNNYLHFFVNILYHTVFYRLSPDRIS